MLSASISATASNVATQGLAIAFKLQDKFSWKQAAAAGVAAAVSTKINGLFGGNEVAKQGILERTVTAGARSITTQLIVEGKVNWRTVGIDAAVAGASRSIEKLKGAESVVAETLLGAAAAKLRKQDVLAGAYSGAMGSIAKNYYENARGMKGALVNGLIGAGSAALTRQDIAAGFIGGATGSLVGEYMPKAFNELHAYAGPADMSAPLSKDEFRLGLTRDDILEQIVAGFGAGVAKAAAELVGRDGDIAAVTGGAAASRVHDAGARAISARVGRMNQRATELPGQKAIDQEVAHEIATREFGYSLDPTSYTADAQLKHVEDTLTMFGATGKAREQVLAMFKESQKPSARIERAAPAADPAAAPTDGNAEKPAGVPDTVVVIGKRNPRDLEGLGKLFNSWQDPLATGGRMSTKVGEVISGNKWLGYGLTVVEVVTSPVMFAGRELFEATDFGQEVMKKVETATGAIMDAATGYVNWEGQIRDEQKSSEMVGGLLVGASLAGGGIKLFTKVAKNVKSFFTNVDEKISNGEKFDRHRFTSSRNSPAHVPEPESTPPLTTARPKKPGSDGVEAQPAHARTAPANSTQTPKRGAPDAPSSPHSTAGSRGKGTAASDALEHPNGKPGHELTDGKTPDLIPEKKLANGPDHTPKPDTAKPDVVPDKRVPETVAGKRAPAGAPESSQASASGDSRRQKQVPPVSVRQRPSTPICQSRK